MATARSASPLLMRWAASPMRISPAAIIVWAACAPPDGLMTVSSPSPSAEVNTASLVENGACSSAMSILSLPTPAFSAAMRATSRW